MVSVKFCAIAFVSLHGMFRKLFGYVLVLVIFSVGFGFALHAKFGSQLPSYGNLWDSFVMMYLAFIGEMEQISLVEYSPKYGRLVCGIMDFIFPMFLFNFIIDILVENMREDEEARMEELLPFSNPDGRAYFRFSEKLKKILRER